jgi:hypothetical protein
MDSHPRFTRLLTGAALRGTAYFVRGSLDRGLGGTFSRTVCQTVLRVGHVLVPLAIVAARLVFLLRVSRSAQERGLRQ